ncbi:small neutral amino acid transporter SnatA (MarC family) [Spirosoma lacussanchae]
MESKKRVNFIFIIVAFMLGTTVLRHFDVKTLSFKMPALDILFLIAFIVTIYLIIKDYRKTTKE